MMLIAVALLIAVGPEQLPGLVRRVGSTVGQFRSMSDRLRADFTAGMEELDRVTDVKGWTDIPTPDFTGRDPAADSARPPNRPTAEDYDPAAQEDGVDSASLGPVEATSEPPGVDSYPEPVSPETPDNGDTFAGSDTDVSPGSDGDLET